MIPNHYSANLSKLDLEMVRCIPPGGNWKNIPVTIPSKRLEQIRRGFAAGNGSRSTYYGRLQPDAPAYTITTYFGRPGNGCYIHYDYKGGQHRVLSQREAARLQGFPDAFVFVGSRGSVSKQIGNAVPPILAYQLAISLGKQGKFVDLFSGAGGLSFGFKQAGWKPLVANDIDPTFLETYARNIHSVVIPGDIRDSNVSARIIEIAQTSIKKNDKLFVLGGPPCQGFSTAGNRRSREDERNHLYKEYAHILNVLHPVGFVFENVTGLLSMEQGVVFEEIRQCFCAAGYKLIVAKVSTEQYAVPQRRQRIIIIGMLPNERLIRFPEGLIVNNLDQGVIQGARRPINCEEALEDLPPLEPGEDGSQKDYRFEPRNTFQLYARGCISMKQFVESVKRGDYV